jgi:hypothetical protein
VPDFPSHADHLYELPLAKFTEARNALAAELKGAGEPELGREVKRLRKPSLVAWALNQVARRHPDKLAELAEVGDGLVRASESGDAGALRELTGRRKAIVRELTQLAGTTLSDDGHAGKGDVLTKISGSLYASATDRDGRALLQRGRLSEDLSGGSLEGMLAAAVTADASGAAFIEEGEVQDRTARRQDVPAREARDAEANLERLRTEAHRAEADATRARRDVEVAEVALEAARNAVGQAEREADEARNAAEQAEREASGGRRPPKPRDVRAARTEMPGSG